MIQFVVSPRLEVTNMLGAVQLHCHDATWKINLSYVYKFVPNYLNSWVIAKKNAISSTFQAHTLINNYFI